MQILKYGSVTSVCFPINYWIIFPLYVFFKSQVSNECSVFHESESKEPFLIVGYVLVVITAVDILYTIL
jgi:hypothetical protein